MKVTRIQINMVLPETFMLNFPNGRDDYLFVMFKSPSILTLNGKDFAVDKGDAVLFNKFDPQRYYPSKGKFVHDFMHFEFENETERKEFSNLPFSTVIHTNNYGELSRILKLILRYFIADSSVDKAIMQNLGRVFLLMLKNNAVNLQDKHFPELLDLRTEIHSNPQLPWTTEDMAKKVALSNSYFQVIYKNTFGISCMADVINSRIEMAKNLLINSDVTVSQTAEACGYNNEEHFIRQFKTKEGITPYAFRKQSGVIP